MTTLTISTDGSCIGNPGAMGIAFRIRSPSHTYDRYAYVGEGTNNAAELLAAAIALEHAPPQSTITLSSDSQYVIGTLTLGWKRRTNLDLWSRMDAAIQRHTTVTFVKVASQRRSRQRGRRPPGAPRRAIQDQLPRIRQRPAAGRPHAGPARGSNRRAGRPRIPGRARRLLAPSTAPSTGHYRHETA